MYIFHLKMLKPEGAINQERYIEAKSAVENLAVYNNSSRFTQEEKSNYSDVIRKYDAMNEDINSLSWRELKLKTRIRRYLKGIERSKHGKPTRYFLFTQMKAGTKHVEKCLVEAYGLERLTPTYDFRDVGQSPSRIKKVFFDESDFLYGESFISYHMYPGRNLLRLVELFEAPTIVLLRNPAQAIVSHYYYCIKSDFTTKQTMSPGEYYGPREIKGEDTLKQFLIEKTLPRACTFISTWLNVYRAFQQHNSNLINIMYHEDLVRNKKHFYTNLDDTIAIKSGTEGDLVEKFEKLKNHNMRKGSTDEWKEFFKKEEKEIIMDTMKPLLNKHKSLSDVWDV